MDYADGVDDGDGEYGKHDGDDDDDDDGEYDGCEYGVCWQTMRIMTARIDMTDVGEYDDYGDGGDDLDDDDGDGD